MSADPRVLRDELAARVRQTLVMHVDTGMGGLEVLTDVYKPEGVGLIVADEIISLLGIPADTPAGRVARALTVLEAVDGAVVGDDDVVTVVTLPNGYRCVSAVALLTHLRDFLGDPG